MDRHAVVAASLSLLITSVCMAADDGLVGQPLPAGPPSRQTTPEVADWPSVVLDGVIAPRYRRRTSSPEVTTSMFTTATLPELPRRLIIGSQAVLVPDCSQKVSEIKHSQLRRRRASS
jgi:hypothetical protein